jgi:hypothetical protein
MDAEPVWGVTALQAVQELDAGPIWASRTFTVGPDTPRKSTLYNGPVTDAVASIGRINPPVLERMRSTIQPRVRHYGPSPPCYRNAYAARRTGVSDIG